MIGANSFTAQEAEIPFPKLLSVQQHGQPLVQLYQYALILYNLNKSFSTYHSEEACGLLKNILEILSQSSWIFLFPR